MGNYSTRNSSWPPLDYQLHPAIFCLDLELGFRLPDEPKSILHRFYDALTAATQTPNCKYHTDCPIIDQANWILLNWKSLGSCTQVLVGDDFEQAMLLSTDSVIFLAEGVAYVSEVVRQTVRMFLQQKFFHGKPVLFLLANRIVETMPREFRYRVEASLDELAKEVILGTRNPKYTIYTKACRATFAMDKDVMEGLEWLWLTAGRNGQLREDQIRLETCSSAGCAVNQRALFALRQKHCRRPRKHDSRKFFLYRIESDEMLSWDVGCAWSGLTERARSLDADLKYPDFLSNKAAAITTVLKLSPPGSTETVKRKSIPNGKAVRRSLKQTIRKNHALQDFPFCIERESQILPGKYQDATRLTRE